MREVVGERREIVVAMDGTDFDADNQSTLALHLVTNHGRAMPLLWLTVDKDELKNQRNDFEDACLNRLKETLPEGVVVTILADRGFGDVKLFRFLEALGFRYVIRFRGAIHVSAADGETRLAADWVGKGGRARKLANARSVNQFQVRLIAFAGLSHYGVLANAFGAQQDDLRPPGVLLRCVPVFDESARPILSGIQKSGAIP